MIHGEIAIRVADERSPGDDLELMADGLRPGPRGRGRDRPRGLRPAAAASRSATRPDDGRRAAAGRPDDADDEDDDRRAVRPAAGTAHADRPVRGRCPTRDGARRPRDRPGRVPPLVGVLEVGEGPRRRLRGAREHALVRALLADPAVTAVVAAPGNAGIAADVADPRRSTSTTRPRSPRWPPSWGSTWSSSGPRGRSSPAPPTRCGRAGIACFGPSAAAARLEGSKAFAKEVMAAAGVPTARARVCDDAGRGGGRAGRVRRAVRRQGRRSGRRQGRRGHRRPRGRAGPRGRAASGWSSRSSWTARRCRCSR